MVLVEGLIKAQTGITNKTWAAKDRIILIKAPYCAIIFGNLYMLITLPTYLVTIYNNNSDKVIAFCVWQRKKIRTFAKSTAMASTWKKVSRAS